MAGRPCYVNAILVLCVLVCALPLVLLGRSTLETTIASVRPEPDTKEVEYVKRSHTLLYGDEKLLRSPAPFLPGKTYRSFVQAMPIVCVDVLLQRRSDMKVLLVKRHAEPVKGLWWYPGGRLLMGEDFEQAARRKVRSDTGLRACYQKMLGTWNTFFEKSAWGERTQDSGGASER